MLQKIDRLIYMDYLIRIEGTGNMKLFAKKTEHFQKYLWRLFEIIKGYGRKNFLQSR